MSVLKAKVVAVNKAMAYANQLFLQLSAIFTPLVGQKIVKADGTLLAKIRSLLPELPYDREFQVIGSHTDLSLAWSVRVCVQYENGTLYHEVYVYVGDLYKGVLKKIGQPFEGRSDYTAEEIEFKRARAEKLKEEYEEALAALHPFKERDW